MSRIVANVSVDDKQGLSDRDYIILACNSHDALVEAIKQAKGVLTSDVFGDDGEILDTSKVTLEKVEAALALVADEKGEA